MDETAIQNILAGLPVPQVRYFDSIGSTNNEAMELALKGAEEGSLVAADLQTQGRGRLGRRWITRPGAALAFSVILRPTAPEIERLALFTALGGLAVAQAVEESLGLSCLVKWPNDVLLGGRKCAGILTEAAWSGERMEGVVVGIGVNVSPEAVPPPGEVIFPATSVENAAGRPVKREELLREIVKALFYWRGKIHEASFLQAWQGRLAYLGAWVQIQEATAGSSPVVGQVLGLAPDGGLLLRGENGKEMTISTGDVHLRPA